MRRLAGLSLPFVLLVAACGSDLPSPGVVANLRVLGVQADPPEAATGQAVTLSSLVMLPDAGAAVERLWAACVATPGAQASSCALPAPDTIPPACSAEPEAAFCTIGGDETVTYTVPARALLGRPAGEAGQVIITLVAAATADGGVAGCAAGLANPEDAPENCRVAVKRIAVMPAGATAGNKNPGITGLVVQGDTLTVTLAPDAVETTPDGPEELFLSWFVTGGELDKFRTDNDETGLTNTWTAPPEAGAYRAAVVVRDGRGGESWATVDLTGP
jgi:hypothetical protein